MSRPFDYVYGKKLDLSIKEHRDTVIKRNKLLEEKLTQGICLHYDKNVRTKIIVRVNLECYVCGSLLEEDSSTDETEHFYLERNIPTLKCDCCKTIYDFDSISETFHIVLKK